MLIIANNNISESVRGQRDNWLFYDMWTSTVCGQWDIRLLGYCEIISSQAYALNGAFKEHALPSGEARLWEEQGNFL